MDFSRFKPGQRACVQTLDAPLVVSAGAGSGKTFTLTQRIAWALMEGSAPDGGAFLDGIDQVMAITFTDKAAGEIKSRVKSTLRAEGMAAEALKVDDAWISTIHGMCSRILRTHAVELGIDPAFEVLDPARADDLMRASVQRALSTANEFVAPGGLDALFAEYPGRSSGSFGSDSIEDMLIVLVRTASANPAGFACFRKPARCSDISVLVRCACELIGEVREGASAQKPGARRDTWLQKADSFIEVAQEALCSPRGLSAKRALKLFDACPWPSAGFGTAEYKAFAKDAQETCAHIVQEARYAVAEPLLDDVLGLASAVYEDYKRAKRELGVLDNDDLLLEASRALADREDIAQEYAHKFKLIMVDEFQDTDQLQVDMIKRMAGPGATRLCTVGDAQQSIYRFRGADVEVYKRHLADVAVRNPQGLIELPDNFRSHGDVLKLVDRIFEQPHVFGSEFMSLAASRFESSVKRPFLGGPSRVDVLVSTYPARCGIEGRSVALFEARRIARRFSELRACGHTAGDMVVLLGRMTRAGLFAQALREEGFACVIAGGSIFSSAPEVRIMQRLAEVIANPHATAALFEVLSSEMFLLDADDFIALSTYRDEERGIACRRGIDRGIEAMAVAAGLAPQCAEEEASGDGVDAPCAFETRLRGEKEAYPASEALLHAVEIVHTVASCAGRMPMARIMEYAVRESGWLARLEARGAEGQSVAGNVLKAIRLVEDLEAEGGSGPSSVARAMAAHIAIAKEAPGALSAKGGDFVRIMTVHASKGLEFPIVALAEMGSQKGRSSSFSCTSIDGAAYVSLRPSRSVSGFSSSSAVSKAVSKEYRFSVDVAPDSSEAAARIERAETPMEQKELLDRYVEDQELQERRRLLYVGLTRAKEALVVAMTSARPSRDAAESGIGPASGVYDDIRSALFGFDDIPQGESMVDFGGSAPARVHRIDADEADFAEASDCANGAAALQAVSAASEREAADGPHVDFEEGIPHIEPCGAAAAVPAGGLRDDVASFSALIQADPESTRYAFDRLGSARMPGYDARASVRIGSSLVGGGRSDPVDLGSAFHMLAQRAADMRAVCGGGLARPDGGVVTAVMRACGLSASVRGRLTEAFDRWLASDAARACERAARLDSEMPFFVDVRRSASEARVQDACAVPVVRYLEGSIDLFAAGLSDASPDAALIVDYKTGGAPGETVGELYAKHALQAVCYAYAALRSGYGMLDVAFVYVEHPGLASPDAALTIDYRFERDDIDLLERIIRSACARLSDARSA
ncbi:MAG: UvrD-helicase domain-containing protein [Slackia sp.]|nr:UvrD-helicase domain-containing protein [Slackia sp.]